MKLSYEKAAVANPAAAVECRRHQLRCSACGDLLLEVMVGSPDADFVSYFRAECCFCGDRSFPVEVRGAGLGIVATDRTIHASTRPEGRITVLETAKMEVSR